MKNKGISVKIPGGEVLNFTKTNIYIWGSVSRGHNNWPQHMKLVQKSQLGEIWEAVFLCCRISQDLSNPESTNTLPETNMTHENRPGSKRKRSYSNHQFSGAVLVSGRVVALMYRWKVWIVWYVLLLEIWHGWIAPIECLLMSLANTKRIHLGCSPRFHFRAVMSLSMLYRPWKKTSKQNNCLVKYPLYLHTSGLTVLNFLPSRY